MIRLERLYVDNFKSLRQVGLCFPAQGSVLIEGLNESGKSTLFEAVYFALYGRPLVSEAGLDSTIRYGAETAIVELALSVDATELLIRRHLRRGRPGRARLLVRYPDGAREEITRLSAITPRLIAELGGLDGETLLNSCFVEQKKLQRLEGLDAAARRHALLRLLNLEAFSALEARFKVGQADDTAVRVAEARRDLARLRAALPQHEAAVRDVETRLRARQVASAMDRLAAARAALARDEAEQARLTAERAALEARLARCAALEAAANALDALARGLERGTQARETASRAREQWVAARRAAEVTLPALERQARDLGALQQALSALAASQTALAALEDAAEAQDALDALAAEIVELERADQTLAAQLEEAEALRAARERAERCTVLAEQLAHSLDVRQAATRALAAAREDAQHTLPAARERLRALQATADTLATAEAAEQAAALRVERVRALADAEREVASARAARDAAERALREIDQALATVQADLERARSAETAQRAPLLTAWIAARTDLEAAQRARADQQAHQAALAALGPRHVAALQGARGAEIAAVTCLSAAVAGLLLVVGLGALGASLPALAALAASVALGVAGIKALRRAGAARAAAGTMQREMNEHERALAALQATLAAHASARERLALVEQGLRQIGEPLPTSLVAARQRLEALAQVVAGDSPQERLPLEEAERRLRERHTDHAGRLAAAQAVAQRQERALDEARATLDAIWPTEGRRELDTTALLARAQEQHQLARETLHAAQRQAELLGSAPTVEALRLAAATLAAEVRQLEQRTADLPALEQRVREAEQAVARAHEQYAAAVSALEEVLRRLAEEATGPIAAALPSDGAVARTAAAAAARLVAHLDARLAALDAARLTAARPDHAARLGSARGRLVQHQTALDDALARVRTAARDLAAEQDLVAAPPGLATALAAPEQLAPRHRQTLRAALEAWAQSLAEMARTLGVCPTLLAVQEALTRLEVERQRATELAETLAAATHELQAADAAAVAAQAAVASLLEAAQATLAALAPEDRPGEARAVVEDATEEALLAQGAAGTAAVTRLAAALRDIHAALDEAGARRALDATSTAQGHVRAQIAHQRQMQQAAEGELATLLTATGLPPDAPLSAVRAALPALDDPALPDAEALERQRDSLREELGALRAQVETLEREWHLADVPLEVAACEAAYAEALRQRAVKQQASRIVALARSDLVGRVLPSTEHNLRLLLPQLTAQRYHDAQLSEDYRLTVWDAEAGRFVAKEIFSGGTRDQFSLALRLAFALATLPQERGTTPGFIFLDEPLSAFDLPRTQALIELLTEGYIARSFAQIFLISHSRAFDPGRFTHYLRLHEGRIAETTLPCYTPD